MQSDMQSLLINAFLEIPNYVFIKDTSLLYRACNKNFAKFAGFNNCIEVDGKSDYDMPWCLTHSELYREEDLAIIKNKISFELKEVSMRINDTDLVLLVSKAPLFNDTNEVIGILGVYIDISDRKQLERELLVAKNNAEAASKSKSEFIANMNHDIRTPITGILAMTQHMLNVVEESKAALKRHNMRATLQKLMSIVKQDSNLLMGATNELLTLCNDILDVVESESSQTLEVVESFKLENLLQQTINLLMPVANDKNLTLTYTIDPAIPNFLSGSRLYFDRILLNLTSNALKFTEEGFVKVHIKLAGDHDKTPTFQYGDNINIELSVEDSGVGIPEDKQDVIFEHFSKLNTSYSSVYKGAGLGLNTVKRYVEAMNGQINVFSIVNKGSIFKITLPFKVDNKHNSTLSSKKLVNISENIANDNNINTNKTRGSTNAKILIVEDSPLAAIGLETQLKAFPCQVEIAENGRKAIEMAKNTYYDLILLDMGLPDFSGIEVSNKIRKFKNQRLSQVPIVVITSHANDEERKQACASVGIQAVLTKPASMQDLSAIYSTYIAKN